MSDKSSTFAPEIGNGHVRPFVRRKRRELCRGATLEEITGRKHIPQVSGRKERCLSDFGHRSFRYLLRYGTDLHPTLENSLSHL